VYYYVLVIEMVVVAELNIIPLGEGPSVGRFLLPILEEIEKTGVNYQITPMCTIFEAEDIQKVFEIAKRLHGATFKSGVKRVVTTLKVDERRDIKVESMLEKVESLKKH
jgi:uncharacterized protein (TIGR00106 family)